MGRWAQGISIAAISIAAVAEGGALAQPSWAQPKDPKMEEAKRHMDAGVALYNDPSGPKCEEAVKEFSKAFELSGSVKAARARGICEMALELDGAAIDDLQNYVDHQPKDADPKDVAQATNDLKALKAVVATVTFSADVPTATVTTVRTPAQGLPITNHYPANGTVRMHPGHYTFTATADGSPDVTATVEIANGDTLSKAFDFAAARAAARPGGGGQNPGGAADVTSRPMPVAGWIMGAVTIACIAPTVAFGVLGLQGKSDFNAKNGKASQTELQDLHDTVVRNSAISDVFLGVTIASAITTTILIVARPTVHTKAETKADVQAKWTVVPTFGLDPARGSPEGGAVVMGSF